MKIHRMDRLNDGDKGKRVKVLAGLICVSMFVIVILFSRNFEIPWLHFATSEVSHIPVDPSILRTGYSSFTEFANSHQYDLKVGLHYDAPFALTEVKYFHDEYDVPKPWVFDYMLPSDQLAIPYHIVTYKPRIHYFPAFVMPDEADKIIKLAQTRLHRSEVAVHKGSSDSSTQDIRTSFQTWFPHTDPVVAPLAQRICSVMNMNCDIAEQMMVLRYEKGQHYVHHVDYFDPQWYGEQKTNRVATFFVYLSGTGGRENGGATIFPRANGQPHPTNPNLCDLGLRVYPVAGSAVLFYDMKRNGEVDENSLHGGCPPTSDDLVKWAAVIWMRIPVPKERQQRPGHRL